MDSLHEDLRTLILLATARNTLQLDKCKGSPLLHFHDNNEHFYTVYSYT